MRWTPSSVTHRPPPASYRRLQGAGYSCKKWHKKTTSDTPQGGHTLGQHLTVIWVCFHCVFLSVLTKDDSSGLILELMSNPACCQLAFSLFWNVTNESLDLNWQIILTKVLVNQHLISPKGQSWSLQYFWVSRKHYLKDIEYRYAGNVDISPFDPCSEVWCAYFNDVCSIYILIKILKIQYRRIETH